MGERWQQLRQMFDSVCELPAGEWESALRKLSNDDALVEEALSVLRAQTASLNRALEPLQAMMASLPEEELQVGGRLGVWRLVERLAHGGMGTVFVAERADRLFRQRVAIKLLRGSLVPAATPQRLAAERQILAELQHPNIARLYDGGTTPAGHPYLVMEYVEGEPLDVHCAGHSLGLRERVQLFVRVCAAVQAAHARLVVHCDLKPGNVLVRANGEPVLLDFGIARLVGAGGAQEADGFCTPAYASPEQLAGARVGVASDVFSLGVLLTELLACRRTGRDAGGTAVPPPSVLATPDCAWRRRLAGDLDAISMRACAADPQERYASVQELMADLDAWLRVLPVSAARGGWAYRTRRFLRRNRVVASLAGFAVLALVGGLGVSLWQAGQAREQRDMAMVEGAKSRAMLDFMTRLFDQADPAQARGREVTARELLEHGASRIRDRFGEQPEVRAELLGAIASATSGLGHYQEALQLADEAVTVAGQSPANNGLLAGQVLTRARILHHLGRYPEALAALDALEGAARTSPTTPAMQAAISHARGMALHATNRLEEAEDAYRKAYEVRSAAFGTGDRDSQETALRLVSLYILDGRMDDAAGLARSTLAAVRATTGENDPHRADAIDALAMVLANTGPLHEAEALRREELGIRMAVFGASHPSTISARNDLAGVLYVQGHYAAASDIYREVLAARRDAYGSRHPAVATAANNLAVAEQQLGRPVEALPAAREALEIRLATYGPDHFAVATSLHTLGAIELDLGDPAALGHLQQSVASWEAAMGESSPYISRPLRDLARAELVFGPRDPGCGAAKRAQATARLESPAQLAYLDVVAAACALAAGVPGAEQAMAVGLDALRGAVDGGDRRLQQAVALAGVARDARR